ncbi:phospho-sugar mutase [Enteractinococcus coprophilus]|uniref:Phosphomannomutase n=1 Tax=Enteractinococcus coprophilus TaxID=1027633 RepID=A0A543AF96_9MICC|nr:phospho-sugar mutase [Enteractinococcus coprophilus]TQL71240.1 phosphomannomutase [Enteractinococcus coprophilus]
MTDPLEIARQWLVLDPDNAGILTREIQAAETGDDAAVAAVTARFAGYLTFGTAGLRAPLGPGTTRMNRVVVQRAAAGIADFAKQYIDIPSVVIGYDARHGSKDFAIDSAAVLTAAGCRVRLLTAQTPTPVLAFALKHFDADIGIMVTASHNPPADNGYKVYLGPRLVAADDTVGAYGQLTSPTDQIIAGYIQQWNTAAELPPRSDNGWEYVPETIIDEYVAAVAQFIAELSPTLTHRPGLKIVYTAMHGVGGATFSKLLEATGFAVPQLVASQADPDPAFPTVVFPNPEEPGALDEAFATAAAAAETDLIVAHDPDADRLAVAVPIEGQWQRLTGDQVGLLLGARLMPYLVHHDLAAANSIVSAPQLAQLAAQHDVHHEFTPTGFKWICRVNRLGYGYEEALGYAVAPHLVNDKDGLSAAIVVLDLAAELKAAGTNLGTYLAELTDQLGPTLTDQVAVRVPSPSVGTLLVDDLRANPPQQLAGLAPVTTIDYQQPEVPLGQRYGPMNMLEFSTQGPLSARLMIRPSGTEPKVKCYISVTAAPGTAMDTVRSVLQRLRDEAATMVQVT